MMLKKIKMGIMAKTLIILVLLFDGTLIQEKYDLAREMPVKNACNTVTIIEKPLQSIKNLKITLKMVGI